LQSYISLLQFRFVAPQPESGQGCFIVEG